MTKQEIVALIESAIAGQGSAVDVGGALPKILKGIVDLLPGAGPQALPVLEVTLFAEGEVTTEAELLSKFKLDGKAITSAEDLFALEGKAFCINVEGNILYPSYVEKIGEFYNITAGGNFSCTTLDIANILLIEISDEQWYRCYCTYETL